MMTGEVQGALQSMGGGQPPGPPPLPPSALSDGGAQSAPGRLQIYAGRLLRGIAIVSIAVGIYGEWPGFFLNVSELKKAYAGADTAAVQQRADARTALQEAKKELEVARNAHDRLKGEAEAIEAEADKFEQVAISKQNEALNAEAKAKAEADSIVNKSELTRQKALTELANAQVAALAKKTEADQAEQDLQSSRYVLRQSVYIGGLINCPGTTYIAKINSAYDHDGQCQ